MKPPQFNYYAPRTVDEVTSLLDKYGMEARVLAGGQSLVPIMNLRIMRPEALVDLNQCSELDFIEKRETCVAIGAMVRQIDAMNSEMVKNHCPLVSQALEWAGPIAVRSRATVGGTLAHADRVAELPSVAIALDAIMVIHGSRGSREVAAQDFFLGDLTTVIEPGEFLRETRFPICAPGAYSSFQEVSVRTEGVAVTGLAAYIEMNGNIVRKSGFAAMGVDGTPVRLSQVESLIEGRSLGSQSLIDEAGHLAMSEIDPMSDLYASDVYRKRVIGVLLTRALSGATREKV